MCCLNFLEVCILISIFVECHPGKVGNYTGKVKYLSHFLTFVCHYYFPIDVKVSQVPRPVISQPFAFFHAYEK